MSNHEFHSFASDCRLTDKAFPPAHLDLIFQRVNFHDDRNATDAPARTETMPYKAEKPPPDKRKDGGKRALSASEWIEALVRIAAQKYTRVPDRKAAAAVARSEVDLEDDDDSLSPRSARGSDALADKLHHLLAAEVLSRASSSEIDDFKALVYSPKIQDVLNDHQPSLHGVFTHYAAAGKSNIHIATMDVREFQQMLQEAKVLGESLSKYDIGLIFANAQSADDKEGDVEMVYREFLESLVAVALFKNPNIMLPPSSRLRDFLVKQFFPVLRTSQARLAKIGLAKGEKE